MIESIFILNQFGEVLFEKHYCGLIGRNACDLFWEEVQRAESPQEVKPIFSANKFFFMHIQVNKLFFVAVAHQETDALFTIEFLNRFVDICKYYFGASTPISEALVKEHFVTVYQLLDEVNDGGIVFNMEPNILREMITPPSLFSMLQDKVMGPGQNVASVLPGGSLTNVYWRRANARYTTNEIYFDLIESINAVVDRNGAMVSSEVVGEAQVNCKLSGMPDLILKFTNSGIMDDVALHPCVRYARWEREKLLSFIPPDGEFKLFDYRVIGNIQLPLYVKPNIMFTDVGGRVQVVVGSKYNTADKPVEECVIIIPFSKNTTSATLSANAGTVTFDDMTKVCRWSLGRLKSGATPQLEGTVNHAPGTPKPDSSPTILVEFKVTMWAASGLKVDTLTLQNEKYNPYKGVRTITKAGVLQIRS